MFPSFERFFYVFLSEITVFSVNPSHLLLSIFTICFVAFCLFSLLFFVLGIITLYFKSAILLTKTECKTKIVNMNTFHNFNIWNHSQSVVIWTPRNIKPNFSSRNSADYSCTLVPTMLMEGITQLLTLYQWKKRKCSWTISIIYSTVYASLCLRLRILEYYPIWYFQLTNPQFLYWYWFVCLQVKKKKTVEVSLQDNTNVELWRFSYIIIAATCFSVVFHKQVIYKQERLGKILISFANAWICFEKMYIHRLICFAPTGPVKIAAPKPPIYPILLPQLSSLGTNF